jgi:RNase H-like domain found in reverse transcriptase
LKCAPLYEVVQGTEWNKRKTKKQKVAVADWASKWGEAQQKAFDGLKAELADPASSFSVAPVPGRQKRVVTDASGYCYGAVLLQLSKGGTNGSRSHLHPGS